MGRHHPAPPAVRQPSSISAMTITLLAVSLNEQPLSQPITACFDANGGTIGRADHNTMALPDPERHISRLQAEIVSTGSRYTIKNVGAANPIVVGARSLAQGESAPLSDRDQVRIGGYLLQVVVDPEDDLRGADITRGRAAVAAGSALPAPAADPWGLGGNPGSTTPPPRSTPQARGTPAPSVGGMADFGQPLSSSNPFADLMGSPAPAPAFGTPPLSSGNTFADLMPAPAGVRAGSSALGAGPAAGGRPFLPDDLDVFAAPARPAAAPPPPAPLGNDPFGGLIPSAAPSSLDDAFGLKPAAGADPLAAFMAGLPSTPAAGDAPSPAAAGGVSTDPLALFGGTDKPAAPVGPAVHDHTPDLLAGFVPPRPVMPPGAPPMAPPVTPPAALPPAPSVASPVLPTRFDWQVNPPPPRAGVSDVDLEFTTTSGLRKPTPGAMFGLPPSAPPMSAPFAPPIAPPVAAPIPAPIAPPVMPVMAPPPMMAPPAAAPAAMPHAAAAAPRAGAAPDALWAAFCQGAGIDPHLAAGLDEAMMQDIGALLRSAVQGTLQLMSVRATTKHELRAAVTIIQQRGNNPLKFSPDATTGLEQLLRPTMRGFLSGPAAMTDAMHDLVGHAIGTVAGMRAALDGMLERFAPGQLEAKLVGGSLLDSVLPMNRKAKLWELYLQHFESIREEAQEDFHSLFGKAFLAAYDQQLERLKQGGGVG